MKPEGAGALRIAVTMGDPAGVGPEILLHFFRKVAGAGPDAGPEFFAVAHAGVLDEMAGRLGGGFPVARRIAAPEEAGDVLRDGGLPVLEPEGPRIETVFAPGECSALCGAAAWSYIREAVGRIQGGEAQGVVTGPIHKEALRAAGCPYTGHTTMLADMAGGVEVMMLLTGGGIRVALATIHKALAEVPGLIDVEGLLGQLRMMDGFLPRFGLERKRPRIGVCGLNPHAGEGGMFGREEIEIIAPAIEKARGEGIDAVGPLPADTAFHHHLEGSCDGLLAMYHDQGLIPVKTLDFHGGVNVTMGLPFIRTSVDHGTAFDIAGKGLANPGSLFAAADCAALLLRNWSESGSVQGSL